MGKVEQKGPPTTFFQVTSRKEEFSPQKILTFCFKPLAILLQKFQD